MSQLFPLGQIVSTPGALEAFHPSHLSQALHRHAVGDWGTVGAEDAKENELALRQGFRILSAFTFRDKVLWVLTEADRSVTTLLLPEEY